MTHAVPVGQPDAEAALEFESAATRPVRWTFLALYTLAFTSTNLLFLAPLLVTLALKVNALVGISQAPQSLALVASIGALLSMVGNPIFGRMSDRTSSQQRADGGDERQTLDRKSTRLNSS